MGCVGARGAQCEWGARGAAAMGGGPAPVRGGGGVADVIGCSEQQRAAFAHRPVAVGADAGFAAGSNPYTGACGARCESAQQRRRHAGFAVGAVVVSVRGCCDGLCIGHAVHGYVEAGAYNWFDQGIELGVKRLVALGCCLP